MQASDSFIKDNVAYQKEILQNADNFVVTGDHALAKHLYQKVLKNTRQSHLKNQARSRLARIERLMGSIEQGVNILLPGSIVPTDRISKLPEASLSKKDKQKSGVGSDDKEEAGLLELASKYLSTDDESVTDEKNIFIKPDSFLSTDDESVTDEKTETSQGDDQEVISKKVLIEQLSAMEAEVKQMSEYVKKEIPDSKASDSSQSVEKEPTNQVTQQQPTAPQQISGVVELRPPEKADSPFLLLTYDFRKIPSAFALSKNHQLLTYLYYRYKPMLIRAQQCVSRKHIAKALDYYTTILDQNLPSELEDMIKVNVKDIHNFISNYLQGGLAI